MKIARRRAGFRTTLSTVAFVCGPLVVAGTGGAAYAQCNGGPTIIRQPAGAQIDQNENATFDVVATGEGELSYQWLRNGAPIREANSPSLIVSPASLGDAGSYTCAVSDRCGTTDTMAVTLEVTARLRATVGAGGSVGGIVPGSDPPGGDNPPPSSASPLPVNALFFEVSGGQPGTAVEGTVTGGTSLGDSTGFSQGRAVARRLEIRTDMEPGTFALLVVMGYDHAAVGGGSESALRLHLYDETTRAWSPAGPNFAGDQPPPLGASADLIGTHGIDTAGDVAWAVLDRAGTFAIGVPVPPPAAQPLPAPFPLPAACQSELCGICLLPLPLLAMLGGVFVMKLNLVRARRGRRRS